MTPMEAWRIISANLTDLYKMRRSFRKADKGYTDAEVEAEIVCFMALREAERKAEQPTGYGDWVDKHG